MRYDFFVIEGPVSELQIRGDILNLLKKHQGKANLAAGVAGVASNQFGVATGAAMVGSYEGEESDRFACYIGEHLVEGIFSGVLFKNGDYVKAVVEHQPKAKYGALYAHAVLRPSDGLLSMPYNTGRGTWAELWKNLRWGGNSALFATFFSAIVIWMVGWHSLVFLLGIASILFLTTLVALWSWLSESEGELSTAIFRALDFPNPKSLNLMSSSICPNEGYMREYAIFRYRRIISATDDKHGSPEPEPLLPYAEAMAQRIKQTGRR